jgi:hypothetical protein
MSETFRREIPLIITAIVTLFMLISYFLTPPIMKNLFDTINSFTIPITAFFLVFGAFSSLLHNSRSIIRKDKNWEYQTLTIVMILIFFFYGITFGISDNLYVKAYNSIIANGETVLFAILAFWFVEASFYAFRIRNIDMFFFTITALIVMIGKTPYLATFWAGAAPTVQWFLNFPMSSAYRGIIIAVAISVTLMAIRIILLRERGWMGGKQ